MEDVLDNWDELEDDERCGVLEGKSSLWQLKDFDVISQIPAEWMHSVCEGVVKATLK